MKTLGTIINVTVWLIAGICGFTTYCFAKCLVNGDISKFDKWLDSVN